MSLLNIESGEMKKANVRIIGLTGGIATGKNSIAHFLQDKGAMVIDADQLAREVVKPGSRGLSQLVAVFGEEVCSADGELDRQRMGAMVFSNASMRRQLEEILHPEIKALAEERIKEAIDSGYRVIFYMAPLLIEAGAIGRVDEVWVVTVRPEVQLERLMLRDQIGRNEAQRIVDSQMPLSEKERYGKVVIDNSGTPEETRSKLTEIWAQEIEGGHDRT